VQVNGRAVTQPGTTADPQHDRITLDGKLLPRLPVYSYFLLHKPTHVVSTLADPQGRPTVRDLLFPRVSWRLFPVGRLDFDSSGLLLMTNDGELTYRLTHPRYQIPKAYQVKVRGLPEASALERLRRGVVLEEGKTVPAQVKLIKREERTSWLEVTVHEGRKRQVRRMCEAVGHPVVKLVRVGFGPLRLGDLPPSALRPLTPQELHVLRRAVGLA
jgi:pseudouridine synthase